MNVTRRAFLGSSVACLAAGCAGLSPSRRPGRAVQLYSIWDYINAHGFRSAFAELAETGYEGVEFCGYYGKSAAEVRGLLNEYGLVPMGSHISFDDFSPTKIGATLDYEAAVGNRTVVMGFLKPPKDCTDPVSWWRGKSEALSVAAETVKARGFRFAYHNHQHELHPLPNGERPLDILFDTFPSHVAMEMDLGHLLAAGAVPRWYLDRYADRAYAFHLTHWDLLTGGKLERHIAGTEPEWLVIESSDGKDRFDSVRRGYATFF